MSKGYDEKADATEEVPLHTLRGRASIDTANSSDLGHLISDDVSEASSAELPPVDGGRGAWTFLLGCWLVEAMIWGFPLAFGVFQRYYSASELFRQSNSIPTIGTLATGMSYLGMPFTNPMALRWPQHRRKMCVAGWLLCLIGLVGASFAQEVWQLLFFQGFLYGVGWVICYTPFLFMLNEWFVEKRGLAYGILFGASGVSGLVIPNVVGWMLDRYGFRAALRVYAVATVVISAPGLFLIRFRSPSLQRSEYARRSHGQSALQSLLRFARDRHFMIFAAAVFLQGLGFFIPNVFLPTFAEALGSSTTISSGLLALLSLSQVFGQVLQGWISDRVNIYIPVSLSALIPGLGALLLWGPAKGLSYLAPFAFLWGLFSASYSVLYTRICTSLADRDREESTEDEVGMLLYGFFSFERGISNVLEGPISSFLINPDAPIDISRYGLGRYAAVVWFTVSCMLVSSLSGAGWLWRPGKSAS